MGIIQSRHSRRIVPMTRSQIAFAFGLAKGERNTARPNARIDSSRCFAKMLSRSWSSVSTKPRFGQRFRRGEMHVAALPSPGPATASPSTARARDNAASPRTAPVFEEAPIFERMEP